MSTRALIAIEGLEFNNSTIPALYKHWDGYPEATLDWLVEFNEDFSKNRGDDPEYKFAQLIRSSVRLQEKYDLDSSIHTGWGVVDYDTYLHSVDYVYVLKNDGRVEVIDVDENRQDV